MIVAHKTIDMNSLTKLIDLQTTNNTTASDLPEISN